MKPDVWGPHAWFLLHSITIEYPNQPTDIDKNNMKEFINAFQKMIPCIKCRENFKNHTTKYPLTSDILSSRDSIVNWMIDIHNEVNKLNNKPILTYDEALNKLLYCYENDQSIFGKCSQNYVGFYVAFCVLISTFVILFFLFKY